MPAHGPGRATAGSPGDDDGRLLFPCPDHPGRRLRHPAVAGQSRGLPQASGRAVRRGIAAPDNRATGTGRGAAGTGDHGGGRRPGGADQAPIPGDRSAAAGQSPARAFRPQHRRGGGAGGPARRGRLRAGDHLVDLPVGPPDAGPRRALRRPGARRRRRGRGLARDLRHNADPAGDRLWLDRTRREPARPRRRLPGATVHREATARDRRGPARHRNAPVEQWHVRVPGPSDARGARALGAQTSWTRPVPRGRLRLDRSTPAPTPPSGRSRSTRR